jgi:hypothetical protein
MERKKGEEKITIIRGSKKNKQKTEDTKTEQRKRK